MHWRNLLETAQSHYYLKMHSSKYIFTLTIFLLNYRFICGNREKRTLIYPAPKSKVQFIYGIGLPVALEEVSVVRGYVIKANYYLPINSWNYTNPETIITRRRRNVQTRWNLYNLLSHFLSRFGGKSCVLRTICEFAEYEFDKNFGFYEELFHVVFRPSSTTDQVLNPTDNEFGAAEKFGYSNRGVCGIVYSECKFSLIEYLTI